MHRYTPQIIYDSLHLVIHFSAFPLALVKKRLTEKTEEEQTNKQAAFLTDAGISEEQVL